MARRTHISLVTGTARTAQRVRELFSDAGLGCRISRQAGTRPVGRAPQGPEDGDLLMSVVLVDGSLPDERVRRAVVGAVRTDPDQLVIVFGGDPGQRGVAVYLGSGARDFVCAEEMDSLPAIVQSVLPTGPAEPGVDKLRHWCVQDAAEVEWALWRMAERVFVKDRDLRFAFANEPFARDRGTTPEGIVGKSDCDYFPPGEAARYQAADRRVMDSGEWQAPSAAPRRQEHPYYDWWKIPIKDEEGRSVALLGLCGGVFREPADAEKLSHYASLVAASHDAIMRLSPTGLIAGWNWGAETTYGYSAEEVTGRRITDMVAERDRALVLEKLAEVRSRRSVSLYETKLMASDGVARDVSLSFSPVVSDLGMLVAVSAVGRDITRRKEAQRALRRSEERFRHLVESAFDGISICQWDPVRNTRRLVFCNDRFVEMSGRTRGELLQQPDVNRLQLSRDPDERAQDQFVRLLKGLPCWGTASWQRPDGKENVFEFSATCARVEGSYLIMSVDRDITRRTELEHELRLLKEQLGRAVADPESVGECLAQVNGCARSLREDCAELLGERGRARLRALDEAVERLRGQLGGRAQTGRP